MPADPAPARLRPHALPALAAAVLVLIAASAAAARPGSPDAGFGRGGTAVLGPDTRLRDVAVQRDGKVVLVGESGRGAGKVRLLVQRLNSRGRPDRRFHRGKPVLGPVGSTGQSVMIQRGGKIVVAGAFTSRSGTTNRGMLVMRLRPNGSRDRSFSGDGRARALAGVDGRALAVTAGGGGRVLVAGGATLGPGSDGFERVALARFRPTGGPDRSFGRGGAKVLDLGRLSVAEDVAVQRGGRIVIGGSRRPDLQTTQVLAARLRPGGSPDRSFASGGVFARQYARNAGYSAFHSLSLAGKGRILLAGNATTSDAGGVALVVRLNGRGRPDRRFDGDGAVYVPASRSPSNYSRGLPVPGALGMTLAGGRIVLAGYHDDLTEKELALWALRPGGGIDRRFGQGGHVFAGSSGSNAIFAGVARAPRGRVVAVGERTQILQRSRGIAARYAGP